ncbi:hypothetical protein P7K49_019270 [Saguinus oedipus]|uniref:Uncharacterized protein n=1 Tax=Saguinus oedipus TaxID=9490 RepID=A0ABQ9UXV1_SAGOE|nr:hypothetical protein P7K49_019270 [Saguinus oedipus]
MDTSQLRKLLPIFPCPTSPPWGLLEGFCSRKISVPLPAAPQIREQKKSVSALPPGFSDTILSVKLRG